MRLRIAELAFQFRGQRMERMNWTVSLGRPQRAQRDAGRLVSAVLLSSSLIAVPVATAEEQEAAAVLKLREVSFVYRSADTVLSCGEIRGRVESVLRTLGAREDLKVQVTGCDAFVSPLDRNRETWPDESDPYRATSDPWGRQSDPFDASAEWGASSDRRRSVGPRQSAHVQIRAMMPVEMTPEVREEIKKDKSRRELISRVNPSADLGEPIVFPAERRVVELSRRTLDLDPEECELMEQMSRRLFKELDVRVVRRPSCPRGGGSRIPPTLTVEALLPKLPTVPKLKPE